MLESFAKLAHRCLAGSKGKSGSTFVGLQGADQAPQVQGLQQESAHEKGGQKLQQMPRPPSLVAVICCPGGFAAAFAVAEEAGGLPHASLDEIGPIRGGFLRPFCLR